MQIDENDVVQVFENVISSTLTSVTTKCYAVTSLAKLATRYDTFSIFYVAHFRFGNTVDRINSLVAANQSHLNLELQQRSVEFGRLLEQGELK